MARRPRTRAFGRPKKYQQHRDLRAYVPLPDYPVTAVGEARANGSVSVQDWLDERQDGLLPAPPAFFPKIAASFNDPRCVYFVLDCVCMSSPGSYIRATTVADYLNNYAPQWYWDANVVGRVLAGIYGNAVVNYNEQFSQAYEDDAAWLPFTAGRDTQSKYYVVDPKGGNEGRLWLLGNRRLFFLRGIEQQRADAQGENGKHWFNQMNATDSYLGFTEDPVRSLDAYRAQLDPQSEPPEDPRDLPAPPKSLYAGAQADQRLGGR